MKVRLVLIFFSIGVIGLCFWSCIEKPSQKKNNSLNFNHNTLVLTVARGAFHYDQFILRDTTITYYPQKETFSNEDALPYTVLSTQHITPEVRDHFVSYLLNQDIWNSKTTYTTHTSCASALTISLTLHGKKKIIHCEDYQRDCPKLLQYIESEIVRLHGKKLKRIYLPG